MKLIYKGKYEGKVEGFPSNDKYMEKATQYKEAESVEELSKKILVPTNVIQIVLMIIVGLLVWEKLDDNYFMMAISLFGACILSFVLLIPHEFLHGICYKNTVYLYHNLKQLMLFVVGEDHKSKAGFIFMCLLPNILFGFIPFIVFLINPNWYFLGFLGMFCIPCGTGDYLNVYNTIKQVPKNAKIFMNGVHSYWYIPEK